MSHLYCARCGLHLAIRPETLNFEDCPRCMVRHATATRLAIGTGWRHPYVRPELPEADHRPPRLRPARPRLGWEARLGSTRPPTRGVPPPAPGGRLLDRIGPVAAPAPVAA